MPRPRGEPPAPSVGTRPGALFPPHLLWVPNRNRTGTSSGRWAGRRAVPSPALLLLLPVGRLRRSREMPQKRGASRRGSAVLRSAAARGAGSGGSLLLATARGHPKPSLGTLPRACRRAVPPAWVFWRLLPGRGPTGAASPPDLSMAGYLSPAAYLYVEEQEYLQAYEDVLERYKGTRSLWWAAWRGRAHGNRFTFPKSEPPLRGHK